MDSGKIDKAHELITKQTMTGANAGSSLITKNADKFGDENKAFDKGQIVSLEPGPDGKFAIVDMCRYCGKQDPFFKEPAVMQNHIKNKCKMTTNCTYCHDLIEASELKDHLLNHCKKGTFKNCDRCKEVFTDQDYKGHAEKYEIMGLCLKQGNNEVRCCFCEKDITMDGIDIKDCWLEHLTKKCMYHQRDGEARKKPK